jgi:hypothetical protein
MDNAATPTKGKRGPPKGSTHSGSFRSGADPRRMKKMLYDPSGKPMSIAQLARNDTRLALDLIRQVLPDTKQPMDRRLHCAKLLINLGWAAAPKAIVSSVTHHQGNLPSTDALMHSLATGEPLQLPPPNDSEIIDIPSDSLSQIVTTHSEGI